MSNAPGAMDGPLIQEGDFSKNLRDQEIPVAPSRKSIVFIGLRDDRATFNMLADPMPLVYNQIGFHHNLLFFPLIMMM